MNLFQKAGGKIGRWGFLLTNRLEHSIQNNFIGKVGNVLDSWKALGVISAKQKTKIQN